MAPQHCSPGEQHPPPQGLAQVVPPPLVHHCATCWAAALQLPQPAQTTVCPLDSSYQDLQPVSLDEAQALNCLLLPQVVQGLHWVAARAVAAAPTATARPHVNRAKNTS